MCYKSGLHTISVVSDCLAFDGKQREQTISSIDLLNIDDLIASLSSVGMFLFYTHAIRNFAIMSGSSCAQRLEDSVCKDGKQNSLLRARSILDSLHAEVDGVKLLAPKRLQLTAQLQLNRKVSGVAELQYEVADLPSP